MDERIDKLQELIESSAGSFEGRMNDNDLLEFLVLNCEWMLHKLTEAAMLRKKYMEPEPEDLASYSKLM